MNIKVAAISNLTPLTLSFVRVFLRIYSNLFTETSCSFSQKHRFLHRHYITAGHYIKPVTGSLVSLVRGWACGLVRYFIYGTLYCTEIQPPLPGVDPAICMRTSFHQINFFQ